MAVIKGLLDLFRQNGPPQPMRMEPRLRRILYPKRKAMPWQVARVKREIIHRLANDYKHKNVLTFPCHTPLWFWN